MTLSIDETNPLPLYHQLQEILREKVVSGEWPAGSQIPTEVQLVDTYGVSTITVRNAVMELVRAGLLIRKRGKGTFVSQPKVEGDFIKEFIPAVMGGRHSVLKASVVEPKKTVRDMLLLEPGQKVTELIRLRYFGDEPASLEKSYVPYSLCPELPGLNLTGRLIDWFRDERRTTVGRVRTYLEAGVISQYESTVLNVRKGSPTLLFTRLIYDTAQRPFIVMKSVLRGDRVRMVLDSDHNEIHLLDRE